MMARMTDRLRDDEGIALPLVMGVIAVLTVVSVASFVLASNALNETNRHLGETEAFQIANAGADAVLEQVYRLGFGPVKDAMEAAGGELTGSVSSGDYVVTVEQMNNSEYRLVSVGTDATGFSETIVMRFFYINLWEMIFAAGNQESLTAGGGGINGNSNVTGPFFVRGTVQMGGGSYVHKGPFFVDGAITRQGNASLGTSAEPIQLYVSGAYPNDAGRTFYSSVSQSVPRIELPRMAETELQEAALKAQNESKDNVMGSLFSPGPNQETAAASPSWSDYRTIQPPNSGTFTRNYARNDSPGLHAWGYKYIGNSALPSAPGEGTTGLTIGPSTPSFGARYGAGYTTLGMHDDFAYDATNRVLYVYGTVFIDGPLTITAPSSDPKIRYVGNGTIIANGPITIDADIYPYRTSGTEVERRRMGEGHVLGLATPSNMTITSGTGNNTPTPTIDSDPPQHALALYAGGKISFTKNQYYVGSIVAGQIDMGNNNVHLVTDPDLPSFLPDSLPGRDSPILTKGAWARQ